MINIIFYIILYLSIFLIIDYFITGILTQSVKAMELPPIIADVENVVDANNSEGELLHVMAEDELSNNETSLLLIVTTG